MKNRVCVIIPMYNFGDMTRDCVKSVEENAGIEHTILVVDDGSDKPYVDERNISGLKYQEVLNSLPLDCEKNTWERISFEVDKK